MNLSGAPLLVWLNRAFWRWCELIGQCQVVGEAGAAPVADLVDGRAPDPGAAYIAGGLRDLERFLQARRQCP